MAVQAVHDAVGRIENVQKLALPWLNSLKVHAAALPLAEFTGVIGNLRGGAVWRDSAWRRWRLLGPSMNIAILKFHCSVSSITALRLPVRLGTQVLPHQQLVRSAARHFFDELTLDKTRLSSTLPRTSCSKPVSRICNSSDSPRSLANRVTTCSKGWSPAFRRTRPGMHRLGTPF